MMAQPDSNRHVCTGLLGVEPRPTWGYISLNKVMHCIYFKHAHRFHMNEMRGVRHRKIHRDTGHFMTHNISQYLLMGQNYICGFTQFSKNLFKLLFFSLTLKLIRKVSLAATALKRYVSLYYCIKKTVLSINITKIMSIFVIY